jgi:hypothetical protein
MLVNALLETPVDDEEFRKHIAKMFRVLELAIKDVLVEAATCGELAPGKDPAIQAKLLVNNIYGLRVSSKLQHKSTAMTEMVEDLLSSLESNAA